MANMNVKRRRFLKQLGASATLLPAMSALSADRVRGANDRVNVALIGCGSRGNLVGKLMHTVPGVDFIALCDVYDAQIPSAQAWAGANCKTVRDFRHVLD